MKLLNLMLADAADAGADGKLFIHGGGVARVEADRFPHFQAQLALVLTLAREEEKPGGDHQLRVTWIAPDGETVDVVLDTNIRIPANADPEQPLHVNVLVNLVGLSFPTAGLYWFAAELGGTELGRVPLRVGEGPQDLLDEQRITKRT